MSTITDAESVQIQAANSSSKQPIIFVHGLWLLASSWDSWTSYFSDLGYACVAIDWPGDQPDVAAARADASALAGVGVGEVADHVSEVARALDRKPILIGHSFGGLLVQIVAGRGLAAATVSIDAAPSKGVLPLPFSALKSSFPVLGKPSTRKSTVMLTAEQFRYGFANAVDEAEARDLYERFHVPGPGRPLFQAATANISTHKATYADKRNPDRGPMLIITGELDNIAPHAIAKATFKKQSKNPGVTELVEIPGVGHSLVIDSHWREVADAAAAFIKANVTGSVAEE